MEAVGLTTDQAYVAPRGHVLRPRTLLAGVLAVFLAEMALDVPARANLAHAYHAAGQFKRASAHFDRALRAHVALVLS